MSFIWLVSIFGNVLHGKHFSCKVFVVIRSLSDPTLRGMLMLVSLFQCRQQEWLGWLAPAPPPPLASPPWTAVAVATTSTACWRAAPLGAWTTRPDPRPWRSPAKPTPTLPPVHPSHSNLCALCPLPLPPSLPSSPFSLSLPFSPPLSFSHPTPKQLKARRICNDKNVIREDVINILTDAYY